MRDLYRSMLVGLLAGFVFSLVAFMLQLPIEGFLLLMIPLFSALLSALGAVVANAAAKAMEKKGMQNDKLVSGLGFLAAAVVNCLIVIVALAMAGVAPLHPNVVIALFLGLVFGGLFGIYSYRMDRIQERMVFLQTLADKNQELQEATRKMAIAEERNRMSRDLHDAVSQGLHGIMYSLHSLEVEMEDKNYRRMEEIVRHLEATTRATQEELRHMIKELKPSQLAEEGLLESLRHQADFLSQRMKVPVETQLELVEELTPEAELSLYRITQEALANIERHAQPEQVWIKLWQEQGKTCLEVKDDGKGFNPDAVNAGNGLQNMKTRAESVGGSVSLDSSPGAGTTVLVTLKT